MSKKANQPQEMTDVEYANYDTPLERPPRHDLRRDHTPNRDPDLEAEALQKRKDLGGTSVYQKKLEQAKEAKRSAKGKEDDEQPVLNRNLQGFVPKKENLMALMRVEAKLDVCLKYLSQAMSEFYALKSVDITPDGRMGGRGFILEVPEIRARLYGSVENISGLIDTIYDEINGEHWKALNQQVDIQKNLDQMEQQDLNDVSDGVDEGGEFEKVSSIMSIVKKVARNGK